MTVEAELREAAEEKERVSVRAFQRRTDDA